MLRIKIIKHFDLNKDLRPSQVLEVVKIVFNQVSKECREKKINFIHCQGKRKHQLQRDYEKLKDWENKLETYEKHLEIMGENRNSYSKTDHDATFMRMKEDHMRNGQLIPAYNELARPARGGPSKRLRLHHRRRCIPPFK